MRGEDTIGYEGEAVLSTENGDEESARAVDKLGLCGWSATIGILHVDVVGEGRVGAEVEEEVEGAQEGRFVVATAGLQSQFRSAESKSGSSLAQTHCCGRSVPSMLGGGTASLTSVAC